MMLSGAGLPRWVAFPIAIFWSIAGMAMPGRAQAQHGSDVTSAVTSNAGQWVPTGSLGTARGGHSAVRLLNGKVLVVGGFDGSSAVATAELYDPATGTWSATGRPIAPGSSKTLTLLRDGRVLAAGGLRAGVGIFNTAELYDPNTGSWTATASMIALQSTSQATLLPNGRVLVVDELGDAQLYDPQAGTWSSTGRRSGERYAATMTLLQNGNVMTAGGALRYDFEPVDSTGSTAFYDPARATWATGNPLIEPRHFHTATLLPSGKVLVAGGMQWIEDYGYLATSEVFDPATTSWSAAGNLGERRAYHTATLLQDGSVLLAAGLTDTGVPGATWNGEVVPDGARIYDAARASWRSIPDVQVARYLHTATLLEDGSVLVVGGVGLSSSAYVSSAERYYPAASIDDRLTGAWYDPTQPGHGIFIEVLPEGRLLAWWFTFNPAGTQQAWFGGVGTYSGNTATIPQVVQTTGGRWIPNFNPQQVVNNAWGSLSFTFSDADHGRVDFDSIAGFGTGSMNLTRLTQAAAPAADRSWIGSPVAVAIGPSGSVYFSSTPNRVFKLDAAGALSHVAGSGAPGFAGDGGPATQARLNFPFVYPEIVGDPTNFYPLIGGLAVDATGNLYIADAYNNRVRRVDPGGIITTVAGDGARGNTGDGGPATSARFWWPQGVAADAAGNVFVSDSNGTLREVNTAGVIRTLVGNNCGPNYLGPGLCVPEGVAVDANANIFVTDGYCRVRRVRRDGSAVTVAGDDTRPDGSGFAFTCGYSGDGGIATRAALSNLPYGVAVGAGGVLYIADTYNHCIRKVDAAGIITTIAGACRSEGYAGDGGPATSARLKLPHGVAVDATGIVYVADTGNHRVRRISPTGIITTIAGTQSADAISPVFTGVWYDPAQAGHGLFLEVLPDNRVLAWWFSFDPAGTQQTWFGGVGTYSGNTATITEVVQTTGGRWIPNFNPQQVTNNPWGTLTLSFSDCAHGTVQFNSTRGFGTGSMTLERLTLPAGQVCP